MLHDASSPRGTTSANPPLENPLLPVFVSDHLPPPSLQMQHAVQLNEEGLFEDEALPDEFASLIDSGEIIGYLQLAGHYLLRANLKSNLGKSHEFEWNSSLFGFEIPGALIKEYEVVKVFGDAQDDDARNTGSAAVAYRPKHAPHQLLLVFRAVRLHEHPGYRSDVKMLTSQRFNKQPWQAEGERMSLGIAKYLKSCEGLFEWLQQGEEAALPGASFYRYTEVRFIGHSLGASLAQAAAYRACRQAKTRSAVDALRVVSFGGTQWVNAEGARSYHAALGSRALHLATFLYQEIPASLRNDALPEWWAILNLGFGGMRSTAFGCAEAEGSGTRQVAGVIDPLVAAGCAPSSPLPTRAIESSQDVVEGAPRHPKVQDDIGELYKSGPSIRKLIEWPFRKTSFSRVEQFFVRFSAPKNSPMSPSGPHMSSVGPMSPSRRSEDFDDRDQFSIDYFRLHRGRSYQLGLLQLIRERQKKGKQAAVSAAERIAGESTTTSGFTNASTLMEPTGGAASAIAFTAEQPLGEAVVDTVATDVGIIEANPRPAWMKAFSSMVHQSAAGMNLMRQPTSAVASAVGKVSKATAIGVQKTVDKVSEVTVVGVRKTVKVVTLSGYQVYRQPPVESDESPKPSPTHRMQRTSSKRSLADMSETDLMEASFAEPSSGSTRGDGPFHAQIQSRLSKRPSVGTRLANLADDALILEAEDGRETELSMV